MATLNTAHRYYAIEARSSSFSPSLELILWEFCSIVDRDKACTVDRIQAITQKQAKVYAKNNVKKLIFSRFEVTASGYRYPLPVDIREHDSARQPV